MGLLWCGKEAHFPPVTELMESEGESQRTREAELGHAHRRAFRVNG